MRSAHEQDHPDDTSEEDSRTTIVGKLHSHLTIGFLAERKPERALSDTSNLPLNSRKLRPVHFTAANEGSPSSSEVMADQAPTGHEEHLNQNSHPSRKIISRSPPTTHLASLQNVAPSINWNRGTNTTIRTSLRSNSNISQSSNPNGVGAPSTERAEEVSRSFSSTHSRSIRADNSDEVISVSDESSVEPAGDSRAIVVNLDEPQTTGMTNRNEPIEVSDEEEEDTAFMIDTKGVPLQDPSGENIGAAADGSLTDSGLLNQLQMREASSGNTLVPADISNQQGSSTKIADRPRKLSDLDRKELDDQFKYALFYLDREQIDLNRAVTCMFCLEEGHMQESCPLKECEHCGAWDEHFSQNCPQWRRCLRCRERGHDVSKCTSKLKDTTVPCDLCGSSSHIEDRCCLQWNVTKTRQLEAPVELYICCANCGQNTHLVGDCPRRKNYGHFAAWTLQDLDSAKVVNLSLQKGTRKFGADEWGPKPELRIKGRARNHAPAEPEDFDDEEDAFFGPRVERQERSHIRFGDDRLDVKRLKLNDGPRGSYDSYQPDSRAERYEPPPRGRRDDDHDRYYNPFRDDRRRSRSPPWDDRRAPTSARDDRFRRSLPSPPRGSSRTHPPTTRGGNSGGARRGNYQPKKRGFGKR